jgi:hypothetical protein
LDCTKHHLLTVFQEDAAEKQKFYISNLLKKPQRVTVRAFFTRVEQLNSFVSLLLCLYNSPRATQATKPDKPFNEAELATLLLRMCPDSWKNQYNFSQDTIPQDSRRLLGRYLADKTKSRMVIPTLSLKIESSREWTRNLRKLSSPLLTRRSIATTLIAIPTLNRKLGGVVRGN